MKKEILVAIDGSIYSSQALSYLATLFATQEDISFRLCTWITASSSVMPSIQDPKDSLLPDNFTSNKKESTAKLILKKARDKLITMGINSERIDTFVKISGYDIAANIQQYGEKNLLDAILVGRRGLNAIGEMLMGSVSANLFKKCHSIPLWLIDGEVKSKNFLVPVDGSLHSLLAVDHLAHILADRNDIQLFLFHCTAFFGKKAKCTLEDFYQNWDKQWCDTHLSGSDCLFNGPQQLFMDAGIPKNQINILPETANLEESRGIIRQAKQHNCGTIVMGRHGVGIAKGLWGGVSDRTIKQVENLALWVVG